MTNWYKTILKDIAMSIAIIPCTESELRKRDFVKNVNVTPLIEVLLKRGWIYEREKQGQWVLHTYKRVVERDLSEYQ